MTGERLWESVAFILGKIQQQGGKNFLAGNGGAVPLINSNIPGRVLMAKPEKKFMVHENIFGQAEADPSSPFRKLHKKDYF